MRTVASLHPEPGREITPAGALDLLEPFVGARLRGERSVAIDIYARGIHRIDASIRAVGPEGITTFRYRDLETDPWDEVSAIMIAELAGDGERLAEREYRLVAERSAAA